MGLEALEKNGPPVSRHFPRLFLCGLGHTVLDEGEEVAARTSFQQAILHLRGRSKARCGGRVIVQALDGLARSGGGAMLDEALALFKTRRGLDFHALWGCNDGIALWEMYLAVMTLGRDETGRDLLRQPLAAGLRRGVPKNVNDSISGTSAAGSQRE